MSLGEADAKFPNQSGDGIPPSPTRENPGQVYPKSDPQGAPAETVPGTGTGGPTSEPVSVVRIQKKPQEPSTTTQEGPLFTD